MCVCVCVFECKPIPTRYTAFLATAQAELHALFILS